MTKAVPAYQPAIFIAAIGEEADVLAQKLVYDLRAMGCHAERDLCGRSVKAQMKYANKAGGALQQVAR